MSMSRDGIVLTNGCFDLFHYGHVRYLERCRELGRYLIVCIDSDDRVRRLKGEGRPIYPQYERCGILNALACVTRVHVFSSEAQLRNLIGGIQPTVLVKGKGYDPQTLFGARMVRSYGGSVRIVNEVWETTTKRIERIRRGLDTGNNPPHGKAG